MENRHSPMTLPGWRLRAWAERWCEPRTMARLVDPILADLQAEHYEAVTDGSAWRCRLAWLRAILALARAAAVHSLVVRPYEERRPVGRALVAAVTSLFVFVVFMSLALDSNDLMTGLAYVVPSMMPVAVPASLVCAIVFGLGEARRRLRACVMALSIVVSFASFCWMASVVPASNQAYRAVVGPLHGNAKPLRGVNELTFAEVSILRAEPAAYIHWTMPIRAGEVAYSFHGRLSLACAPVILALSTLAMARGRRRIDAIVALGIVLVHFARFAHTALLELAYESPIAIAWGPNAALLTTAIATTLLRFQRSGDLGAGSGSAPRTASMM